MSSTASKDPRGVHPRSAAASSAEDLAAAAAYLYDCHGAAVYTAAFAVLGDRAAAEEAVVEVFAGAARDGTLVTLLADRSDSVRAARLVARAVRPVRAC